MSREEDELKRIKAASVLNLPDEPSLRGYTPAQIKRAYVEPVLILYEILTGVRSEVEEANLPTLIENVRKILEGGLIVDSAIKDRLGRVIDETYQPILKEGHRVHITEDNTIYIDDQEIIVNWGMITGNVTDNPALSNALNAKENEVNKVTSISSQSTDTQYPSAKAVYLKTKQLADDIDDLEEGVSELNELIPQSASSTNKLADKDFVNSSIATATATHRGTYSIEELGLTSEATHAQVEAKLQTFIETKDLNDYVFVYFTNEDTEQVEKYERYKFNGSSWGYEFTLNNSSFTQSQWNSICSGITSAKVGSYDAHLSNSSIHVTTADKTSWNGKTTVVPSQSGTATQVANFLTIEGTQYKLAVDEIEYVWED